MDGKEWKISVLRRNELTFRAKLRGLVSGRRGIVVSRTHGFQVRETKGRMFNVYRRELPHAGDVRVARGWNRQVRQIFAIRVNDDAEASRLEFVIRRSMRRDRVGAIGGVSLVSDIESNHGDFKAVKTYNRIVPLKSRARGPIFPPVARSPEFPFCRDSGNSIAILIRTPGRYTVHRTPYAVRLTPYVVQTARWIRGGAV